MIYEYCCLDTYYIYTICERKDREDYWKCLQLSRARNRYLYQYKYCRYIQDRKEIGNRILNNQGRIWYHLYRWRHEHDH